MNGFGGYYDPSVNPYMAAYQQQNFKMASPAVAEQVTTVNGRQGAEAYNLAPNSSKLLLDISGTILWVITTDGAGFKTCTGYPIGEPIEEKPAQAQASADMAAITEYAEKLNTYTSALEERISRLEGIVNEHTNDIAAVKQSNSDTRWFSDGTAAEQ